MRVFSPTKNTQHGIGFSCCIQTVPTYSVAVAENDAVCYNSPAGSCLHKDRQGSKASCCARLRPTLFTDVGSITFTCCICLHQIHLDT